MIQTHIKQIRKDLNTHRTESGYTYVDLHDNILSVTGKAITPVTLNQFLAGATPSVRLIEVYEEYLAVVKKSFTTEVSINFNEITEL